MTLFIGLDPGGTGRKWAYLCATTDTSDKLYVGVARDASVQPIFAQQAFPYLAAATIDSIEGALNRCLLSLAHAMGVTVPAQACPVDAMHSAFGSIVVSVDAPSGFSIPESSIRATEQAAGGNFNTPNEMAFLASAVRWVGEGNGTPLSQRVYWKLVGFAIYCYFSGANAAAEISAAAGAGIAADLILQLGPVAGIRILESFPSEIYRHTSDDAFGLVQKLARRSIINLPGSQLSPATLKRFKTLLQEYHAGHRQSWARVGGTAGDALDAFSSMMLGIWGRNGGLRAIAPQGVGPDQLLAEGAIVLPV